MNQPAQRVAVDVDGVCADLGAAWYAAYNRDYDDDLSDERVKSWAIHEYVKPECGNKIYDYLTADLYDAVLPILGARDGCDQLRSYGYDLIFVTSTPKGCEGAKLSWLQRHGFVDAKGPYGDGRISDAYVECHNKSLISAGVLIDDGLHNIERWPNLGLLFNAHHNLGTDLKRGYRVQGWEGVLDFIRTLHQMKLKSQELVSHPTEVRSPNQARRFREIIEQMYQVHLDKNADYSPANILGTGEIGGVVRLWDKMARLLNLMGFEIDVRLVGYHGPKLAKNESVDDTLIDMANYAIILKLLREGNWGN